MTPQLRFLAVSLLMSCRPSLAESDRDSFVFIQKHPQEHFCEADFVLVAKVLSKMTSNLSLRNTHHVVGSSQLRPPPTDTTVILVRVKRVFKGSSLAKVGNTVALVSSRVKTDLRVVVRRTYVFTGFVHAANVPDDPCDSLLHMGRHIFVENQLNFMWGCSWFKLRSQLTPEQKQGLTGTYAKGCKCQMVRCHGRPEDPHRFCFGDLKRALFGDGCVMHVGNELLTVRQMTCFRPCGKGDGCRWMMCSTRKPSCARHEISGVGAGNESLTTASG